MKSEIQLCSAKFASAQRQNLAFEGSVLLGLRRILEQEPVIKLYLIELETNWVQLESEMAQVLVLEWEQTKQQTMERLMVKSTVQQMA